MTSLQINDVFYGNPGLARYDPQRRKWLFQRKAEDSKRLQIVWSSTEGSNDEGGRGPTPNALYSRQREKQVDNLIRSEPDIAPARHLLLHASQVSEAIEGRSPASDPLVSDLVAIGVAGVYGVRSKTPQEWPSVEIVASVSGVSRHLVRLAVLKADLHTYQACPDFGVDIFAIDADHPAWYVGTPTPVQQLCFSPFSGLLGGFLAVRRLDGTSILHPALKSSYGQPFYRKHHSVHSEFGTLDHALNPREQRPVSELHPNYLLKISTVDTAGASHIDVAFNPWYQQQLAIIDSLGHLRTFIIDDTPTSPPWRLEKGPTVEIELPVDLEENEDLGSDNWGIVLWVGDETTLVTSTRRILTFFHLDDEKITPLEAPGNWRAHESEQILDVKRNPNNSSQLFVLTSVHVIWLRVLTSAERETSDERKADTRVILSSCHYRSAADESMRLTVNETDHGATLLIYSRETGFISGFTFCKDPSNSDRGHVSDNFGVPLTSLTRLEKGPLDFNFPSTGKSILAASLHTLHNCLISDTDGSEKALNRLPSLQQLFYISEDYNIKSLVYAENDVAKRPGPPSLKYIRTRQEPGRDKGSHKKNHKHGRMVEESYFVVPDGAILAGDEELSSASRKKLSTRQSTTAPESTSLVKFSVLLDKISNDFSNIYQAPRPLASHEALVEEFLGSRETTMLGIHTLANVVAAELFTNDIDKASQITQELLDDIPRLPTTSAQLQSSNLDDVLQFRTLSLLTPETTKSLQSSMSNEPSAAPMATYEDLLSKWIHPLPSETPSRLRVWQEKPVQQAAMQLFLASHGVHLTSKDAGRASHHQPQQDTQHIGRTLARYCNSNSSKALPRSLQRLADLWEIGVDPSTFQWREDGEESSPEEGRQNKKGKNRDQPIASRAEEHARPLPGPSTNVPGAHMPLNTSSQLLPPSAPGTSSQATTQSQEGKKKPKKPKKSAPEGFR